jgi:structural maintenance of chromosome 3 (chondroitin sulfate proteoglycan 6)
MKREMLERRKSCKGYADGRLDTTQSKLQVLYAKQGRAQQFSTQAARDKYLNDEIKALKVHEKTQQKRVEDLKKDVEGAKTQLAEVAARSAAHTKSEEERRETVRKMGEEVSELKATVDGMQEQRK